MSEFNILVATHPRSGTHFCIDTLCLNLRTVCFGLVRDQYPTLERLILDHDKNYTKELEAYVFGQPGVSKIFKTHLMPEDIQRMMESDVLSSEDRGLVQHVLDSSQVLYVFRDGRDVLVSWYHYMLEAGGGLPTDLPPRIRDCSFPEFLRMPNRYIPVLRAIQEIDVNRAAYWSAHVASWLDHGPACLVSFEKLRESLLENIRMIAADLGLTQHLLPTPEHPPLITELGRSLPARLLRRWRRILTENHHRKRGVTCYPPMPAYARSGDTGGWSRYFNDDDLAFFDRYAGQTLSRLGYSHLRSK